jgi:hypothetical protein
VGEEGEESGAAPCTAALHGAGRYIEDPGRLGDGISLHIDQDECGALLGGQGGQGRQEFAVQVLPLGGNLRGLMRFQQLVEAIGVIDRCRLP